MSQKNRKTKVGATNQQYPLIQKKKTIGTKNRTNRRTFLKLLEYQSNKISHKQETSIFTFLLRF